MKWFFNTKVYGWILTGVAQKDGKWFIGFSRWNRPVALDLSTLANRWREFGRDERRMADRTSNPITKAGHAVSEAIYVDCATELDKCLGELSGD